VVSGALAAHAAEASARTAPASRLVWPGASGGASPSGSVAAGGRRRGSPAARTAAMIAPAEVPTSCSVRAKTRPWASSIPARTPVIQASPAMPPAASTSASGASIGR
jgi:hypothetical protein